jgi:hypothetical protein
LAGDAVMSEWRKANDFETHHPTLLHLIIVCAGFATYLADPDDIVWRFIRDSPVRRVLEHILFCLATLLIGAGAAVCTWSSAFIEPPNADSYDSSVGRGRLHTLHLGDWLYAVGLAFLAPLWGFIVIVVGESIRIARLLLREKDDAQRRRTLSPQSSDSTPNPTFPNWPRALRRQAVKWGVLLTMVVFAITLVDRVADYGVLMSVLMWALLNIPVRARQRR